jgi:hypothetical protein
MISFLSKYNRIYASVALVSILTMLTLTITHNHNYNIPVSDKVSVNTETAFNDIYSDETGLCAIQQFSSHFLNYSPILFQTVLCPLALQCPEYKSAFIYFVFLPNNNLRAPPASSLI